MKAPQALIDRFLRWKLPDTVCSDLCVTRQDYPHDRYGTSLLTADEARQMLEFVLEEAPAPAKVEMPEEPREVTELRCDLLSTVCLPRHRHELAAIQEHIDALRSRLAAAETLKQGYYNEASEGWTKFRAAEKALEEALLAHHLAEEERRAAQESLIKIRDDRDAALRERDEARELLSTADALYRTYWLLANCPTYDTDGLKVGRWINATRDYLARTAPAGDMEERK